MSTIKQWPETERPRERLLRQGPSALSNAELLAIVLQKGTKGLTAVDLAQQLLNQYGGLATLLKTDRHTLCQCRGIGPNVYCMLQAGVELFRRSLYEELTTGPSLTSPKQTYHYLKSRLRDAEQEIFACLFLDNHHRILCYETLFFGGIHSTNIHPREIVKRALHHNAANVILAHNHPSGCAQPSHADIAVTASIQQALDLFEIEVLDHIIIGQDKPASFAELGLLKEGLAA